ncbi:MAG: orotidine-5'-phosphate decarboxylase [Desulfurococcaceae archaeon]
MIIEIGHLIIVALDPPFGHLGDLSLIDIVEKTRNKAQGYKIGLPLLLEYGLKSISIIKRKGDLKTIVDLKLADIGDINILVAEKVFNTGADAIIAHGFIGLDDAIEKLARYTYNHGKELILVVSMSHRGSTKYIDQHFEELVFDALEINAHGIIVPATKPWLIRKARSIVGDKIKIYTPGIGFQGAKPGSALCAGADYEIIGRLITRAADPGSIIEELSRSQLEEVEKCRGLQ